MIGYRPKTGVSHKAPVPAGTLPEPYSASESPHTSALYVLKRQNLHRHRTDRRGQSVDIFGHGQSAVIPKEKPL